MDGPSATNFSLTGEGAKLTVLEAGSSPLTGTVGAAARAEVPSEEGAVFAATGWSCVAASPRDAALPSPAAERGVESGALPAEDLFASPLLFDELVVPIRIYQGLIAIYLLICY
jgi:hypothetical protein